MTSTAAMPQHLIVPAVVQAMTHRDLSELFRRMGGGTAGFDTGRYKKAELLNVAAAWLQGGVPVGTMVAHANAINADAAAAQAARVAAIAAKPPAAAIAPPVPAPFIPAVPGDPHYGVRTPAPQPVPVPLGAPFSEPFAQPDAALAASVAAIVADRMANAPPLAQYSAETLAAAAAQSAAQSAASVNADDPMQARPPVPAPLVPTPTDTDVRAAIMAAINAQPAAPRVPTMQPGSLAPIVAGHAPMPAAAPTHDEAALIAAALAETARTHPAAALPPMTDAPQPGGSHAAAAPAGREFARELFRDLPTAIVEAIPATLTVPVFNHPQAAKPNASYRWTAEWLVPALIAMSCTPTQRVWFGGPSSTGKTEMARQLAARTGRALYRINFDRYTEASHIIGDIGLVNGNTVWRDGAAALACRQDGAVLLLDEFTYGSPGALACLNPLLERDGTPLRVRDGDVLQVPDSLFIIVADNTFGTGDTTGSYHARNELGEDTRSRFGVKIAFDYLPVAEERALLREAVYKETGRKPTHAALGPLMKILETSRAKASQGELQGAPSLRAAIAFATLLAHGYAADKAYTLTVVNGAPAESHEALRQIYAAHWPTAPDGTTIVNYSLFI